MSKGRLQDKVAIVTGSTKGIGEAIATGFAREGAKVVVCGRNTAKGETVVKEIIEAGGTAYFIQFDLADEQSCTELIRRTVEHFGGLDVMVHNAHPTEHTSGGDAGYGAKLDDMIGNITTKNWHEVNLPTYHGLFWILRATIQHMEAHGGGSIVNISSMVSLQGMVGVDIHTATKGAMNALTRSIAVEYGKKNIRCNAVVLGLVATGGTALLEADPVIGPQMASAVVTDRLGLPKDLVGPALFFASDDSWYVTGQCLGADGGMSVKMFLPNFDAATA
jgi:NAD(P)-dependent dehydrogenase (short-subunit alcohol dehydrogenase family)